MSTWFDATDERTIYDNISWREEANHIPPYRRIMTVVADTPSMHVTVRHAIRLAAFSNAEVDFLAVPNIPTAAAMPGMLAVTEDLINGLTQRNEAILDWAADTAAYAGVSCRTHIRWGCFPSTIMHFADEAHCDLIIMGTPATSGWLRVFQPCIAKRVAAQARQPVLVIKEPCLPSAVTAASIR